MSEPLFPVVDGHTGLSEDDRVGLMSSYITTRGDLFVAEQPHREMRLSHVAQ